MPAYVQHDLGQLRAGMVVLVTPAQKSHVLLIDARNLGLYRRGKQVRATGGPAAAGETIGLSVPSDGEWFVVVDLGGKRGTIRATVETVAGTAIDADVAETVPSKVRADWLLSRKTRETA